MNAATRKKCRRYAETLRKAIQLASQIEKDLNLEGYASPAFGGWTLSMRLFEGEFLSVADVVGICEEFELEKLQAKK